MLASGFEALPLLEVALYEKTCHSVGGHPMHFGENRRQDAFILLILSAAAALAVLVGGTQAILH
jgi:hypothetical protein